VSDIVPQEHVVDMEVAARYFVKIALLFVAECKIGDVLNGPEIECLRTFLSAFLVDATNACAPDGSCLPICSSASISGEIVYWWKGTVTETEVAINLCDKLSSGQRLSLIAANARRVQVLSSILPRLNVLKCGDIGSEFYATPRKYAFHEIDLIEKSGLWCRIRLFGGIFHAEVKIGTDSSVANPGSLKRIRTPWYEDVSE
jgi:hypothetical protein